MLGGALLIGHDAVQQRVGVIEVRKQQVRAGDALTATRQPPGGVGGSLVRAHALFAQLIHLLKHSRLLYD